MSRPLKVFISYSHRNTAEKDELVTRLAALMSEGIIEVWDDCELKPGDRWRDAVTNNLADSDMLLYLVSADNLASEKRNKELSDALHNDIRIIPVILEHCDWLNHELSDFQVLPNFGKPINGWEPESAGWQNVVDGIRKVVGEIQSQADRSSNMSEEKLRAELEFERGNFLTMIRQVDAAIKDYSESIALYPQYGAAYSNRGFAYAQKGDLEAVINDCSIAIEIDPKHAKPYNNRGRAYADIGDLDIAIMDYTKAIELNPKHAELYNNRGITYFKKDEFDSALADFTNAIELQSDFAMAYENRAKVWLVRQELEKAVVDLASANKIRRLIENP